MQTKRSRATVAADVMPLPSARPIREVLRSLRRLPVDSEQEYDFAAADSTVLAALVVNAETSMRAIHLGLAALGQLVARSSVDIADGDMSADEIANLGFLMAELGDLAAECLVVASQGRHVAGKGANAHRE